MSRKIKKEMALSLHYFWHHLKLTLTQFIALHLQTFASKQAALSKIKHLSNKIIMSRMWRMRVNRIQTKYMKIISRKKVHLTILLMLIKILYHPSYNNASCLLKIREKKISLETQFWWVVEEAFIWVKSY